MIELNLLPKELRRKRKKKNISRDHIEFKVPFVLIAISVFSFLLILHLTVVMFVSNKSGLYQTLSKQFDNALTQRKRAEKVNKEVELLQRKLTLVRKIIKPDISWAKLLKGLNDSVISNIWLSSMDVRFTKKQKGSPDIPVSLDLTGYAMGGSERATSTVAKFIVSMKETPEFYDYFDEIELNSMKNREYAGEEVMQFKLECRFKEREMVTFEDKSKNKRKQK